MKINTWLNNAGKTEDGRTVKTGILVPEKVVLLSDYTKAKEAFAEFSLPKEEISHFYRLDDYRNERRFGGRDFYPGWNGFGRFSVDLGWSPSYSGNGKVGSRPAYIEDKVVGRI